MSRKSERECPERRDEAKERMWRGIIAEQEASGKSILGFLRERGDEGRGVNESNFFEWRRKIRARDAAAATAPKPDPDHLARWRRVVAEWRASGLPKRRFLRERNIAETTFSTWLRRVDDLDREAAGGKPRVMPSATRVAPPPRAETSAATVEVELPSGVKLRVAASALRELIAVLGA